MRSRSDKLEIPLSNRLQMRRLLCILGNRKYNVPAVVSVGIAALSSRDIVSSPRCARPTFRLLPTLSRRAMTATICDYVVQSLAITPAF